MEHSTRPPHAADAATSSAPVLSTSIPTKTSALVAVQPTQSNVKLAAGMTPLPPPRRPLQQLDGNRIAVTKPQDPTAAVAKARFAYVSRFSRPLSTTTATLTKPALSTTFTAASASATSTTTTTTTTSLTGIKRKQQSLEEMVVRQQVHAQQQTAAMSSTAQDAALAAAQLQRENIAWLDMLVALLERKYQAYAPPVSVHTLEQAKMLDAYWTKTHVKPEPAGSGSGVKRSRLSLTTDGPATTNPEEEKEEKRTQALRRHAQQIQDTSVASTSCCGCKTGCLKITRGYCHDGCSCDNCKNARASSEQRVEAIAAYLTNDPRAFSFAAAASSSAPGSKAGAASGFFQLLPEKSSTVVLRGCRCKKSKCLKKYCECFQNGLGCGPHCRCVDCSNDSSAAARELRDKNKNDGASTGGGVSCGHMSAAGTGGNSTSGGGFHAIKVSVTKKPRRNYVHKTARVRL